MWQRSRRPSERPADEKMAGQVSGSHCVRRPDAIDELQDCTRRQETAHNVIRTEEAHRLVLEPRRNARAGEQHFQNSAVSRSLAHREDLQLSPGRTHGRLVKFTVDSPPYCCDDETCLCKRTERCEGAHHRFGIPGDACSAQGTHGAQERAFPREDSEHCREREDLAANRGLQSTAARRWSHRRSEGTQEDRSIAGALCQRQAGLTGRERGRGV